MSRATRCWRASARRVWSDTVADVSLNELPPPSGMLLSPAPTEEEAVAIMAATEALWPKPMVLVTDDHATPSRAWRFSGRWWSRPVPARRVRPFR